MDARPLNDTRSTRAPEQRRGHRRARIRIIVSLVIVVGIFAGILPRIADYSAVWTTISGLTWLEMLALIAATTVHFAASLPQMVASFPGLSLSQAAVNTQAATTAANTLPGGGVVAVGVSYAMCRSWGFADSTIVLSTLTTFVWNMFLKLGLPVVALSILVIRGQGSGGLITASIAGVGIMLPATATLAIMSRSEETARRIGSVLGLGASFLRKLIRKSPVSDWGAAAIRLRRDAGDLMASRWIPLTITTMVNHLALFAVLLLALRFVGVSARDVSWAQVLGVFALVRLLSALPVTPGGLGIVDLGYIAGLLLAGRHHADVPLFHAQVAAAVLVFRALTYALQIPAGGFAYLVWLRSQSRTRSGD